LPKNHFGGTDIAFPPMIARGKQSKRTARRQRHAVLNGLI
jgi:hypothetical protein